MGYYSALNRKRVLVYVTTWMDIEDVMLNEISQNERTNTLGFH